jgi:hypothetical protein
MKRRVIAWCVLLLWSSPLLAAEEILSYHSNIEIQRDASLLVTETIEVHAEGRQIQRGIYRDFPTLYQDEMGNLTRVGFELFSVERNGVSEAHHTGALSNGTRIYIGDANVALDAGKHVYRIQYRTTRQLGFFDNYDELYWNVTGNDWSFPILMASANVTLPQALSSASIKQTGYTGVQGSTDRFLTHRVVDGQNFYYETTRPLDVGQGLTIVLNWPKGVIDEPDPAQLRAQFLDDNRHSVIALAGLVVVLAYYLVVWQRVGKDPEGGAIMPLYQPPQGFSPASTRFIAGMSYDKSCFTAALVNLAVKGAIEIDQTDDKDYLLRRLTNEFEASAGEQAIIDTLFAGRSEVVLERGQHTLLGKALKQHETSLREDYEKVYFMTNRRFFMPGILLSLATIALSLMQIGHEEVVSSTLTVGFFLLIPFVILLITYRRYIRRKKQFSLKSMIMQLAVSGLFFSFAGKALADKADLIGMIAWPVLVSIYLLIAANLLFEQWLKAPTLAGRKLLDQIEGLKLYLGVAEADELALKGRPRMSTDIYERLLPYAIALGLDHSWSQQLDRAVAAGLVEPDYVPRGLYRSHEHRSFAAFSDSLSTGFDRAVSAASTPPGSSSGSSGGSSGGGGGGGGGGGW